jgi:hypothetical protein
VKNADGVKQEPAQRLLDTLIGKLSFDPTAFAEEDAKTQADILRKIVGLDFTHHDAARAIAYDRRTIYTKQYKDELVLLNSMPTYDGVPDAELSTETLMHALTMADIARTTHDDAKQATFRQEQTHLRMQADTQRTKEKIAEIDAQIKALVDRRAGAVQELTEQGSALSQQEIFVEEARITEAAALKNIPDVSEIRVQIDQLEDTNSKVRANAARKAVMATVVRYQHNAEVQDAEIKALDETRAKLIRDAHFPITGLSIAADGTVTFNEIALKQASTAEQIRVSVSIGFALNPTLKLLCIKNGNALDEDSRALISECAQQAGGQVLMEVVTKNPGEVSVFIVDGSNE